MMKPKMETDPKVLANIAHNVRRYRNARGWSQAQLSDKSGASPAAICDIEKAKYPNISVAGMLTNIAKALGVTVALLVQDPEQSDNDDDISHFYRALDPERRRMAKKLLYLCQLEQLENPLVGDELCRGRKEQAAGYDRAA